jgi:hypothetical protein
MLMMRYLLAVLFLIAQQANAGTQCRNVALSPAQFASAAQSAKRVIEQLEKADKPLALLARNGTDLSKHGLHYSHMAFVVRDHAEGRWRVMHLLNQCGTKKSGVYVQGLVNFFADDLVSQDFRIVWPDAQISQTLLSVLSNPKIVQLHDADYNLISHPQSKQHQNSTAWILDVLMAAQLQEPQRFDRRSAQAMQLTQSFTPDVIHISYGKRIAGGLFGSNVDFTDHSVATRLAGDYKVITVRSILRFLEQHKKITQQYEFRNDAVSTVLLPG